VTTLTSRHGPLPDVPARNELDSCNTQTMLPYGNGRSYGDSNLNPGGALLRTRLLNRFISFDRATGLLTCESGVLLSEILQLCVPQGWFLPVTPGTQFVTVGGAIANDVHGKNHHTTGSFGNHLVCLELLRSDGSRRVCSDDENPEWFAATIGGLGLTGLITWAQLRLRTVANPYIDSESIRFHSLEEFFEISHACERNHEYTVSWIDCASSGKRLGRGLFNLGNHSPVAMDAAAVPSALDRTPAQRVRRVPITPPMSLINGLTLRAFNAAYFHSQRGDCLRMLQHYRPFFYPLDAVLEWNRVYGPRGFFQYQCVVPPDNSLAVIRELLTVIARSGMGSFLAVLKQFGTVASKGMMSFPMPGTTLALDFPNEGDRLHMLFDGLDGIVLSNGGRLYPAKDGRMGPGVFKAGYARWPEFKQYVDPRFSSGFWRRVMESQ
jgi:FAD/FMN-containing dehydrogenase